MKTWNRQVVNKDGTKQEIQSVLTRHEILHNYLLQKKTRLQSNTTKLNTKNQGPLLWFGSQKHSPIVSFKHCNKHLQPKF